MSDDKVEALELALEDAANFMRGMWLDPAVPKHAKEALKFAYEGIDAKLREIDPETYAD
jgi:hypothetical protein